MTIRGAMKVNLATGEMHQLERDERQDKLFESLPGSELQKALAQMAFHIGLLHAKGEMSDKTAQLLTLDINSIMAITETPHDMMDTLISGFDTLNMMVNGDVPDVSKMN